MNLHYEELEKSGMDLDAILGMRHLFSFFWLHPEIVMPDDAEKYSAEELTSRIFGKLYNWTGEVMDEARGEVSFVDPDYSFPDGSDE